DQTDDQRARGGGSHPRRAKSWRSTTNRRKQRRPRDTQRYPGPDSLDETTSREAETVCATGIRTCHADHLSSSSTSPLQLWAMSRTNTRNLPVWVSRISSAEGVPYWRIVVTGLRLGRMRPSGGPLP